jgi:hypothetical protein
MLDERPPGFGPVVGLHERVRAAGWSPDSNRGRCADALGARLCMMFAAIEAV